MLPEIKEIRPTVFSRDDRIDALEIEDNGWILRDRSSPVKFYNFTTGQWEYAHLIADENRHQFERDSQTALTLLQTVERSTSII